MWEWNVNDTSIGSLEFLLYRLIRVLYLQNKIKAKLGWHIKKEKKKSVQQFFFSVGETKPRTNNTNKK